MPVTPTSWGGWADLLDDTPNAWLFSRRWQAAIQRARAMRALGLPHAWAPRCKPWCGKVAPPWTVWWFPYRAQDYCSAECRSARHPQAGNPARQYTRKPSPRKRELMRSR